MRKLSIFIVLGFLLNGCSQLNEIIVVNLSNHPILVEYVISQHVTGIFRPEEEPHFYCIKKDGDGFEKTNKEHTTVLSKNDHGKISFLLQPNEMSDICSFRGRIVDNPTLNDYVVFNLEEIKFTTTDSTILYAQGDYSRHLFTPSHEYGRAIIFR